MARVKYAIICSPTLLENCNQGNTFIDSLTINGRTQEGIEIFRLADKPCTFLNTVGLEIGQIGTETSVVVNVILQGNLGRTFDIFLCANDRVFVGPTKSDPADNNSSLATLDATYTRGGNAEGGCNAFLKKKAGVPITEMASAAPKPARTVLPQKVRLEVTLPVSEKAHTKQIIKRIIGK